MTLGELATALGAELRGGDAAAEVTGVASPRAAKAGDLVFAEDEGSAAAAIASAATAVILRGELANGGRAFVVHRQPRLAFARAARLLRAPEPAGGVHPAAVVGDDVSLGKDVTVEATAVLGNGAAIGDGTRIGSGAVIGAGVRVGRDCRIYPRVVLYPGVTLGDGVVIHAGAVLGADGFGYVRDAATGEYLQFPQQGTLVVEDFAEIGANTTIDRGALEETRIGRGAKIDNLVHVGHNVSVGRNAVLAAQVGISGSSNIGEGAVLGGQVGIGDHAGVGDGVILGGQAGVLPHKHLTGPGVLFWGTPAKPVKEYLRELATLTRLSRGKTGGKKKSTE